MGAIFAGGTAPNVSVTILDDDQALLEIIDSSLSEPSLNIENMEFIVRLSAVSTQEISVSWIASTEADDEAQQGVDFAVVPNSDTGLAVIPAGSLTTTIAIPIAADVNKERTETFTVSLYNVSGSADISDGSAKGTINDSSRNPSISVGKNN